MFVLRNGDAEFVPVKTGIAGDKYFEVLSGLKDGDQVITGPFNSVRNLKDGDEVKIETKDKEKPRRSTRRPASANQCRSDLHDQQIFER